MKVVSLLQAFLCVILRICGVSHGPSASAELLVVKSLKLCIFRNVRFPWNDYTCNCVLCIVETVVLGYYALLV